MIGLVSNAAGATDALRTILPIGVGLASVAYLTVKATYNHSNIPMASLRSGDKTHDPEYEDDQDEFLNRCEEECGSTFRIKLLNMDFIVVSGSVNREIFLNDDFSAPDSLDELMELRAFIRGVTKSDLDDDNKKIHEMIRNTITPNLALFTPKIVEQLEASLDHRMKLLGTAVDGDNEKSQKILIESPLLVLQQMVASAMANVFVGAEIAKNPEVIETFINATADFAKLLGNGTPKKASFWGKLSNKTLYSSRNPLNPLQKHLRVLVDAAEPVIIERRRLEAKALENGVEYDQPDDVLQILLGSADKYGLVDIEDMCGHILILILASVHTTTDTSTNLLYYLAAFPQHIEQLYDEQQLILDTQQRERENERQELTNKNEAIPPELDPSHDRDLTAAAIKKMAHMDSFVRESAHYGLDQGENPSEFKPWRFVGKSKTATKVAPDFLPFGMGRHACPGRFLAIQELKTIGMLYVQKYSKVEIQDPSCTKKALLTRLGAPTPTGLYFTKRE
ncbi:hypothetical protein BGW38_010938 [Lunasporangiospora selenospora]|uniref:Cytochrome P450 n=1 Tax=Lunasporangiospora selenospora TaxID=979761 RepID=A0A9P6FX00_9FUNG|nr:hypothetical protein BGW38_010938 [Lunasporangiospora selenospora]